MEAEYIKGKHYAHQETVKNLKFRAVHWEDGDGGMFQALRIEIEGLFEAVSCEMTIWPSADELRRLASMFSAAADDIEAHAAFIKARDEAKAGEAA